MIQNKLRSTRTHIDPQYPVKQEVLINPDGPAAAEYLDNMIYHFGKVIKIALEHIGDENTRKQIKEHAHLAIKGEKNENGTVLGSSGKSLARQIYRG